MIYILQLCYVITICIGVSALSVQLIVSKKNLASSNSLAKSETATFFLVLLIIFNICDYLILFLGHWLGEIAVMWVYTAENVLEVILAYALIEMEREYFNLKENRTRFVLFTIIAAAVLWVDSAYAIDALKISENVYMTVMAGLSLFPVLGLMAFTLKNSRKIFSGGRVRIAEGYFLLYNAVFFVLCIIMTVNSLNTRMDWDYLESARELYVIFWFVFNIMNCVLIWKSCLHTDEVHTEKEEGESLEVRILRIGESYKLSEREIEIAKILCKGKNNNDIASELFVSPNTVKVHTSNLYRKLGVKNRVQAVQVLRGEAIDTDGNS